MQQEWNRIRIWNLVHSFMESKIFLTGYEIGLFDLLSMKPLTVEEVAYHCGTNLRKTAMLLDALTASGALQYYDEKYRCDPSLTPFLSRDGVDSICYMVQRASDLSRRWVELTDLIKTDPVEAPSLESSKQALQVAVTDCSNPTTAELISLIHPLASRQMLMIGITTTSFLFPILKLVPGMSVTLTDKKEKLDTYRKWLSDVVNGNEQSQILNHDLPSAPFILHRVSFQTGDPILSPFSYGHDFAILSFVVQQYFFNQNVELFRNTFNALLPGGRIIVRDILCAPERNSSFYSSIYSLNSIIETRGKPPYTFDELKRALEQAGFTGVRLLNPETWMDGVIEAYKPLTNQG